ncbi:hypothetical protein B4915_01220 [Leucobacter massiliensis]|uniref:RNA-binding protein n=1 Tax=Leucobacter massiliensis TaxID=1686285 RepID=A0A2S9QSD1_9MICO|nr:hypothetical protein B4915_01220 [Leucobacter massiliensis]
MRPEEGFATEAYLRAKSVWRGAPLRRRRRASVDPDLPGARPFGGGRDPRALGDVLTAVSVDMGWSVELEQARVIAEWPQFAGSATAEHTTVLGISNGILQVQCDSTSWATELRRLRAEMLTRLLREYPDAEVRDLRFLAPGAPSWRHGPRTVRGRGPRDTYG